MERHRDNIGLLRLIFASLVIVGHAPEMTDGMRLREPLTRLFHTLSLGELAVDAFFLISGYLIANSWTRTQSLRRYLARRWLRIFPAYAVAYLLCCFALGPMVGARPLQHLPETIARFALFAPPPGYPGQLAGLYHPMLNGAMWTIPFEFRCYLLIALLGASGLLYRRRTMLAITALGLAASILLTFPSLRQPLDELDTKLATQILVGSTYSTIRLTTIFLAGSCFHLFKDQVLPRLAARSAAVLAVAALLLMYDPHLAEAGLTVFGGLALFWLALKARIGPLQAVNDSWDISYGVYLYGWPIAIFILYRNPHIAPGLLAALALPLAFACGAVSWWGLEKRTKDLARSRSVELAPATLVARAA